MPFLQPIGKCGLTECSLLSTCTMAFAIRDAADNPVEERPLKGRVEASKESGPLGPVYRFGILHRLM